MADFEAAHIYTRAKVTPTRDYEGTFNSKGDEDWIAFEATEGSYYRFAEYNPITNRNGPDFQILDSSGTPVGYEDYIYNNRFEVLKAPATGRYFVRAKNGYTSDTGNYTVSLEAAEVLRGSDGDDVLEWGPTNQAIPAYRTTEVFGGAGQDTLSFAAHPEGVRVSVYRQHVDGDFDALLEGQTYYPGGLDFFSVERFIGSAQGDTFIGSDGEDSFAGLAGDDLFIGSDGGSDTYVGGDGIDTVDYATSTIGVGDMQIGIEGDLPGHERQAEGVAVSLLDGTGSAGDALDDVLIGIENLSGTRHGDTLTGDGGANVLTGREGQDRLTGLGGDDMIFGGGGEDTAVFTGNRADYTITEQTDGTILVTGAEGTDTLDRVEYAEFADTTVALVETPAQTPLFPGDDYRGDVTTEGTVAVGAPVSGGIQFAPDVDLFRAMLAPGGYTFNLEGFGSLRILDALGDPADYMTSAVNLRGSDGNPPTSDGTFLVPEGSVQETIYFAVVGNGSDTGDYTLSIESDPILRGTPGDDVLIWDDSYGPGFGNGYYIDVRPGTPGHANIAGGTGTDTVSFAENTNDLTTVDLSRDYARIEGTVVMDSIENVIGNGSDTTFIGSAQGETIQGLGGDDRFEMSGGTDSIDGGAGTDLLILNAAANASLRTGTATAGEDVTTLAGIENVRGSEGNDYIEGDAGDNVIRGHLGDDWIVATSGTDHYDGGEEFRELRTDGRDMVSYVNATGRVGVDLGAQQGLFGMAADHTYDSIERFTGSSFEDLSYGSERDEDFRGLGGYDWFVGSAGADRYWGGDGQDTVSYAFSGAAVTASIAAGGGSAGDAAEDLYFEVEALTGSNFDDILTGDAGRNKLRGMYGEDILYGGGGTDYLTGGGSDDVLYGGAGWDVAVFDHDRADYRVFTANGLTSVTYLPGGGEGVDLLVDIEAIRFADDLLYL